MIEFIGVSKKSLDGKLVLNNINLKIKEGEFVYLVGESGSGKTSLLKMIYRASSATEGEILLNFKSISNLKTKEISHLRRKIGIVFQDLKLLKKRTVYKNISYALEVIGKDKKEVEQKVNDALEFIKMEEKRDEFLDNLSQGEKQRVAIARAIVNKPKVIICDEVTNNLNYEISKEIIKILLDLNKQGATILFSTHDERLIEEFPKRIVKIKEGVIVDEDVKGNV